MVAQYSNEQFLRKRHTKGTSQYVAAMTRVHFTSKSHYGDVMMGAMASQITSLTIVYTTVYSGADQRKHQSSASLVFVRGIHQWPVNSQPKWPVTRKMFPFDDVIMIALHMPGEPFSPIQILMYSWLQDLIQDTTVVLPWHVETFKGISITQSWQTTIEHILTDVTEYAYVLINVLNVLEDADINV